MDPGFSHNAELDSASKILGGMGTGFQSSPEIYIVCSFTYIFIKLLTIKIGQAFLDIKYLFKVHIKLGLLRPQALNVIGQGILKLSTRVSYWCIMERLRDRFFLLLHSYI